MVQHGAKRASSNRSLRIDKYVQINLERTSRKLSRTGTDLCVVEHFTGRHVVNPRQQSCMLHPGETYRDVFKSARQSCLDPVISRRTSSSRHEGDFIVFLLCTVTA